MSNPILDPLNDAQRRAVTTVEGPVLVLAGPGSGKTRVLTHRIAYMIQDCGIAPYSIMAVTFTNKAAGEMRERVQHVVGDKGRDVWLGTFHALCARILRREVEATNYKPNFAIYDTGDQQSVIKNIINEMQKDPKQHRPGAILGAISAAKNELIMPEEFPAVSYKDQVVQEVYRRYIKKLQLSNAMDFDDLLMQAVILFRNHLDIREKYQRRLRYLMVDEFQDTNMAQYELVRLLSGGEQNLFVVGDPDQSIYAFRGADYRNVYRFQQDFPDMTMISLDENYRSHQWILDAAMAVIRKDPGHIKRDLFSRRANPLMLEIHELQTDSREADFVVDQIRKLRRDENYAPRDFAVMYRTNAQSRTLEEAFLRVNMPYQLIGGVRFYERMEIKDLLAYLRLINNPDDSISFDRIINVPARGIGKKSIETFSEWVDQRGDSQWMALQDIRAGKASPLAARAAKSIAEFVELLEKWIVMSQQEEVTPLELLDTIMADVHYVDYIETRSSEKDPEDRIENINSLRSKLRDFEGYSLSDVLEQVSLVADLDTLDETKDAPTLLTLHSAKGLEYPVVFLVGLEEGLLPHERSRETNEIAEERRLLYVGITRAKDRLYFCHSTMRNSYQGADYREPSRFLDDLPAEITKRTSIWQTRRTSEQEQRHNLNTTRWSPILTPREPPRREPPPVRFQSGMIVYHSIFGRGTVISSKADPDMEEVMVKFDKAGIKKLDGTFLKTD